MRGPGTASGIGGSGARAGRAAALLVLLAVALLAAPRAVAQYYTWGSDAPQKWSTIRTPDVRMIYPDTASALAQRTLFYIRTVQPSVAYGFTHGPMRIPFVLHPENFRSNGLVMYLPKRVEFLTSPAVGSYSMPWYKQLVAHEYRHAVQYNNLDRGVIRVLSYLIGQQGSTVGLLCMPIWALEGDATMSETEMSSFGRGRQPSFSIGYRAMGRVGRDRHDTRYRKNIDKWFCGSYRDPIPDHYELGYQICSYAYDRYGENVWNKVARFGSRNPYMLATTRIALEKYYDTNVAKLFRETFDDLQRHWDALPEVQDNAEPLTPLEERNYTTYEWPLPLGDTAVLALRTDYDRPTRFVAVDAATGAERTVAHVGQVSTRPAEGGGRVWWTEYRRSALFEQRVHSVLCYMDLAERVPRSVPRMRNVLYPTVAGERLAWVEYTPDGRYAVAVGQPPAVGVRYAVPAGKELHGLAWDDATQALYGLITDDDGMHVARIDSAGLRPVTRPAYITLSHLRAGDGRLYYGSIASGRDEAHCFDLASGCEYRLTESRYGSFAPMPAPGGGLLVTTCDRRGYRVAVRRAGDSVRLPVAPSALPADLVNPSRRRWEVVNLDTVRFTPADGARQQKAYRTRRYRKVPNLVNLHSWMPVSFDPFAAVDEQTIDINLGATLISQNLLSNTEAFLSYGWNRSEGSLVKAGVRYFGLGVQFDFDAVYGGRQLFYSLAGTDESGEPVYQKRPAPDRYLSVGLSALLPLYLQRGYHTRMLSLSAGWNYSNGMVADLGKIKWEGGGISNIEHIGFLEGLHKLSFGAGFSDQVRMAHRDFAPRWGYTLSAGYTFNPSNGHFSDLVSLYGRAWLPGAAPHHSVSLSATYQTSIGGYKFPSGYAPLSYKSSRLVPHGFSSSEILSNNYMALSASYQLPLWYPEGGIPSVLYVKRIRLNIGGDYAQFLRPAGADLVRRRIWAAGGDLLFDINAFRQPAAATSTVRLSLYRPSKGGVWFSVGLGLPF